MIVHLRFETIGGAKDVSLYVQPDKTIRRSSVTKRDRLLILYLYIELLSNSIVYGVEMKNYKEQKV